MVEHLKKSKELARLYKIRDKLAIVHEELKTAKRKTKIMRLEQEMQDLVDKSIDIINSLPRPTE